MGHEVDDAFDWLVLILSTITGVLIGLPATIEAKKTVAGGLILPLLVLVIIWLLGHLTEKVDLKVIFKTFAWFYASFMFLVFFFYFADVLYGVGPMLGEFIRRRFPVLPFVLLAVFVVAPFSFFILLVQPIYRRIYKGSRFISSRLLAGLLYILAIGTFLLLTLPMILSAVKIL